MYNRRREPRVERGKQHRNSEPTEGVHEEALVRAHLWGPLNTGLPINPVEKDPIGWRIRPTASEWKVSAAENV